MKQNNCNIYISKLCNSKRKIVDESCIVKRNDELHITYCENDSLDKFEDEQQITTANLVITDNCVNLIRCISQIKSDERDSNDVANEPHELTHSVDALRYFIAGRPCPAPRERIEKKKLLIDKINKRR